MVSNTRVFLGVSLVLLSGLALALLLLGGGTVAAAAPNAARYVATTGQDTGNSCTNSAFPCRTLQHAVDEATAGDSVLVAAGVYVDVHGRPVPVGYLAPAGLTQTVQLALVDKSLSIQGGYAPGFGGPPDPAANPTTLDAGGQGRVLMVWGTISVTLEGLRVTGGDATGLYGEGGPSDAGGGVYASDGTLVLRDSVLLENNAYYGGGLYVRSGTATVENSSLMSNTAYFGAGLRLYYAGGVLTGNTIAHNMASSGGRAALTNCGQATVTGNTVISNTATGAAGGGLYVYACDALVGHNTIVSNTAAAGSGGGVYLDAAGGARLEGNTVRGNTASDGGGAKLMWSDSTLSGNLVAGNTATSGGGLLLLYSNARLTDNRLIDNLARNGGGGGAWVRDSDVVFTNTVVADNRTGTTTGTGLYIIDGSDCTFRHSTVARNGGSRGTGIYVSTSMWTPATAVLTNTIVTGHWRGVYTAFAADSIRLEATLWDNQTDWEGYGSTVTGTHNYWGDPLFLADGYHLSAGSPAIDRGLPAGVVTDLDGEDRPGGTALDLGADEWWGGPTYWVYLPLAGRGPIGQALSASNLEEER